MGVDVEMFIWKVDLFIQQDILMIIKPYLNKSGVRFCENILHNHNKHGERPFDCNGALGGITLN